MDAFEKIKNYRRNTPSDDPTHISVPLKRVLQDIVDRAEARGCLPEDPEILSRLRAQGVKVGRGS